MTSVGRWAIMLAAFLVLGCGSDEPIRSGPAPVTPQTQSSAPAPSSSQSTARAPEPAVSNATSGSASSLTEPLGQEGVVDWTAGIVTATGIGYPPTDAINSMQARLLARRAAHSVALRNLLEAFNAVRVDSTTTVKNHVTVNDEIQVKVSGIVEDAKVLKERDLDKGGYEVTLQVKLTGRVGDTFVPKDAVPDKRPAIEPRLVPGKGYTGLVVDARGIPVRPALLPKLLTEDGLDAYSQSYVLAKYKPSEGIAAYVSDPAQAKVHPKVTSNPLIVKALRAAGNSQTDLVISNAAAQTIHGVKDHFEFLERAKVIVIIDPRN